MKLQKPKGTQDILPADSAKWQYVENVARETFKKYNYGEIRTPMFEHYEVISRSVGDTTDIVTKEMYDFHDKGDRHITLRPEGTAPVVRSYVENKLFAPEVQKPVKVYYIGSMFRYERPQAGRLREFHQLGVECFGSKNPATDVETIAMAYQLFNTLGIKDVTLHLNSLGNTESRLAYRQALIDYLTPMRESLSKDSQRRLDENPLRVLDSKEKEDKEKAIADLQKNSISKDEYDKKIKEIEENAKKENEDYIYNDLLNKGLDDAKVLKDDLTREAFISLLNKDKDKIKLSDDKKSLIGLKEITDNYKKQAPHFFEKKKANGYEPVNPEGDRGDDDGEISMAANFAKEANKSESQNTKSQFFN